MVPPPSPVELPKLVRRVFEGDEVEAALFDA
jgi:hypothetical protein